MPQSQISENNDDACNQNQKMSCGQSISFGQVGK